MQPLHFPFLLCFSHGAHAAGVVPCYTLSDQWMIWIMTEGFANIKNGFGRNHVMGVLSVIMDSWNLLTLKYECVRDRFIWCINICQIDVVYLLHLHGTGFDSYVVNVGKFCSLVTIEIMAVDRIDFNDAGITGLQHTCPCAPGAHKQVK